MVAASTEMSWCLSLLEAGGEPCACRDHRRRSFVNGLEDLGVINPAEICRGDREIGVTELTLDDQERHSLTGHLDCVSVPELMWSEPTSHPGGLRCAVELATDPCGCAWPPARRPAQDAEQRTDRKVLRSSSHGSS
jgi:hypothetical protein